MVKIRMKRMGMKKEPFYRIVVIDSRNARDGRAIEELGYYNPITDPSELKVNAERAKYGIAPLTTREDLWSRVAMVRAAEIDQYFSHTRPDGRPWWTVLDEAGFDSDCLAGENIGYGYGNEQAVFNAWMNSEGHRENILRETFASLATGFFKGRTVDWSQNFLTIYDK